MIFWRVNSNFCELKQKLINHVVFGAKIQSLETIMLKNAIHVGFGAKIQFFLNLENF